MIGYGDNTRALAEVARLCRDKFPNLPPISQETISKIEKQFRDTEYVRQIEETPTNAMAVNSKLDVMLEFLENPHIMNRKASAALDVQMAAINSLPAMALALDVEKTRNLLLPYLQQIVTEINDEMQINTAEQLKRFIPLVGGYEYVDTILQILVKMCVTDETLVRERAVESINCITEDLDTTNCENLLIPLIHDLSAGEWFTNKCSATALFSVCYAKVSEESKTELRNIYINLTQDEAPLVRKAAASNLVDFLNVLEPQNIKLEFVPVLDNIAKDLQDSVKPLAVDLAVAIAKRVEDPEVKDGIFVIMEQFSRDESWKIRYKTASAIHEIQEVLGADKNRGKILNMFQTLAKDGESEVRVAAMKNLFKYCKALKESYEKSAGANNFEPVMVQSIVPLIKIIFDDPVEDVLLAASSQILSLCTLMSPKSFEENILPIAIEALEKHHFIRLKETIMSQFDVLPLEIGLTKHLESIKKALHNLVLDSKLHWRTRRSILLAFVHVGKYISKEYFDSNLKNYYYHLLDDPIFAVRRTASVILPLLAENFGMKWLMLHLLPSFMVWARHRKYLYRFVALNGINELLYPSIEKSLRRSTTSYISYFNESSSDLALKSLAGIAYLDKKLQEQLSEAKYVEILNKFKGSNFVEENVRIYAEDTLNVLQNSHSKSVFHLDDTKFKEDDFCYLEGILMLCYKSFIPTIMRLSKDNILNVQVFSWYTLNILKTFADTIHMELKQEWVEEKLSALKTDDQEKEHGRLEVFMKYLPTLPYQKVSYDDVKPEDLVTAGDEPLPDLGAEVLDFEISDDQQISNSSMQEMSKGVLNDLESKTDDKSQSMEIGESNLDGLDEIGSLEKEVIDILDTKLTSI